MKHNGNFIIRLFFIVAPVILLAGMIDGKETKDFKGELNRGLAFLSQNSADSAIKYFILSFSKGLSKDSLFYFWSEAFLQKDILDSSLGANLVISGSKSGFFQNQILQQRYRIYKRLGWSNEAEKVVDSLHKLPSYRRRLFVPDFISYLNAGIGKKQNETDTTFPFGAWDSDSKVNKETGYDANAGIGLKWRIPYKENQIAWGISASISKTAEDSIVLDTNDIKGSIFGSYSNKKISASYYLSLNRRIDDTVLLGNSIEITLRGKGSHVPVLCGGINVQTNSILQLNNSQLWILSSLNQFLNRRVSLNYLLYSSIYYQKPTAFSIKDTLNILYAEDASLQYPVFYTNSTYSTMIDTSLISIITGRLTSAIKSSGNDTALNVSMSIPNGFITLNPKVILNFKSVIPIELGLSYSLQYYWEPYTWDNLSDYAKYLVYSRKDDEYYQIPSIIIQAAENGGISLASELRKGGYSLVHNEKVRVDNTISARLTTGLVDNEYINMKINLFCSKTWSNLTGIVPIEIPDWYIAAQIGFSVKIPNKSNMI